MGHEDYKKVMAQKLLQKYRNRAANHAGTGRRIILRPAEIYKNYAANNADIAKKQRIHEAAAALLQMEAVIMNSVTDKEMVQPCKKPGGTGLFAFSYEGGDSEFFNYLNITIPFKCEEYVFKIFKKN